MYDVSALTGCIPTEPCVVILSGVPGVGKTHIAKTLKALDPDALICSADDYVNYAHFEPEMLPPAHQACFRGFLAALMLAKVPCVIIDNTNTSAAEVAPYVLGAESLGYKPLVARIHPYDADACHARNVHGVPENVFEHLHTRFQRRDVMPWWNTVDLLASPMKLFKKAE